MANRAGGEGKPGVPKEVFELDQDERWQARLEEARARREIALRERAAGKASKPRPKPWEIEGSGVEEPPAIEPVIQERGDEKIDFADRLETIREPKETRAPKPKTPRLTEQKRSRTAPDYNPAKRQKVPAKGSSPEPRARPQPSLVLPGAPDVAELAERYAATLQATEDTEPTRPDVPESVEDDGKLVALPTAAQPLPEEPAPVAHAERRRGIRPLGMAFALVGLAALPFAVTAPPLEKGPEMPVIDGFAFEPALGMTWSLYQRPVETRSGDWRAPAEPEALAEVPFSTPASFNKGVALPQVPPEPRSAEVDWREVDPVVSSDPNVIFLPEADAIVVPERVVAPPAIRMPEPVPDAVEAPVPTTGGISAPPRPASLREEPLDGPPIAPTRSESAVESDPLRVTILSPPRVDRGLRDEIAANVQSDGHELVRVKDVDFNISQRNLRYFHAEDRAAAARIADRYDAELRDFTWFRPSPVRGTAELWLAGRGSSDGAGGPRDQGRTARGQAETNADSGSILSRVFDRLGLGTELPERSPGDGGFVIEIPGLIGPDN